MVVVFALFFIFFWGGGVKNVVSPCFFLFFRPPPPHTRLVISPFFLLDQSPGVSPFLSGTPQRWLELLGLPFHPTQSRDPSRLSGSERGPQRDLIGVVRDMVGL